MKGKTSVQKATKWLIFKNSFKRKRDLQRLLVKAEPDRAYNIMKETWRNNCKFITLVPPSRVV